LSAPEYHEPGRGYTTAWVFGAVLVAGFVIDLALGAGAVHVWAWLIAIVLVVGLDVLAIRAARALRTITVTPTELRMGEHTLPRDSIVGVSTEFEPTVPVLGQLVHEGLPRGIPGLAVHLADGDALLVPTRHPDRLAAALGAPDVASAVPDIRLAGRDDLAQLPEIDKRAESLFHVAGFDLPDIPFSAEDVDAAKVVFVAGRPAVGYVWVDEVDGVAHIEELAVVPSRMRRGLGTALLTAACEWAAGEGYPAITLTTFADVAWNAPYYAARGFVVLDEITPGLAAVRERERALGLDAVGRRVVMRRELTG
jgi:GNAT superfamily N-acetyltransferase